MTCATSAAAGNGEGTSSSASGGDLIDADGVVGGVVGVLPGVDGDALVEGHEGEGSGAGSPVDGKGGWKCGWESKGESDGAGVEWVRLFCWREKGEEEGSD